jgi:hypothetical protein
MDDSIPPGPVLTPAFDEPLNPDEFRLKLDFRSGVGSAARVFKFYEQWLGATQTILDEFASKIDKRLKLEIRLVKISEGSADPKFQVVPQYIADQKVISIPQAAMPALMMQTQELINGGLGYLLESIDTNNFNELFDKCVENVQMDLLPQLNQEPLPEEPSQPSELSVADATSLVPLLPPTKTKDSMQNKRKVLLALGKMAAATTNNLVAGEEINQKTSDGEVTKFNRSLIGTSVILSEPKIVEKMIVHRDQELVAAKAILYGNGTWSFLWNGRIKSMTILDDEWMNQFKGEKVVLRANQALIADIRETRTTKQKLGVNIKNSNKFEIIKIKKKEEI